MFVGNCRNLLEYYLMIFFLFGAILSCQFFLHDRNELIDNCISFISNRLLDCRCILVSSENTSILILSID